MITLDTALSFTLATSILAIAPGPDNIFVLTQSVAHGRRAGWFATFGFASGCLLHTAAVTLGVSALITANPTAFTALKIAGSVYLLYLAVRTFLGLRTHSSNLAVTTPSSGHYFRRGIIMNLTNPKVAVFFLALLPQFTDPEQGAIPLQTIQLGSIFTLVTIVIFGGVAHLAGTIQAHLHTRPNIRRVVIVLAGLVYITLAIRFLFENH